MEIMKIVLIKTISWEWNKQMQNWILFQTVTNSDREFVSQPHKKLKNKENWIDADE